jgi:hypothetical protein
MNIWVWIRIYQLKCPRILLIRFIYVYVYIYIYTPVWIRMYQLKETYKVLIYSYISHRGINVDQHSKSRKEGKYSILYLHLFHGFECWSTLIPWSTLILLWDISVYVTSIYMWKFILNICMNIHLWILSYICMYIYMHICIYIYNYICIRIYIYTY